MCKSRFQTSLEEIRTYLKPHWYKSKSPKEAHELTEILKEELSGVRSTLIMTGLKSFLLMRLLLNELVGV